MIIEKLSDRQLAIIYAHMIYRNTELENYHSKNVRMDRNFYNTMLQVVSKNIRRIKRNQKVLASITDIDALKQLRETMYQTRGMEFTKYALEMDSYANILPGSNWDAAQALNIQKPKKIANFILDGHFKECCENNAELDDQIMCYINKDVHNRIFTLVLMKIFD